MRYLPWVLLAMFGGIGFAAAVQTGTGADTLTVVTATSYTIGANTLDTNEWAFLDGMDQDLSQAASDVVFDSMNMANGAFRLPVGTDLPATCTAGDTFLDSNDDSCADANDGSGCLCICISTNTWSAATGA